MKNFSNILATVLVALFLLSFGMKSEVVGQCPSGYSSKTINMNVGGCIYQFDICYKCSPLGMGATKIELLTTPTLITPGCVSTVPGEDVIDYILSEIQTPAFLFSEVCTYNPNVPPCEPPTTSYLVIYNLPQCWQAEVIRYFGEKTLYFSTCSEDYCETTYSICVDAYGNYVMTPFGPSVGGIPSCSGQEPPVPFPNPSYPEHYKTPCYIYHTECD